MSTVEATAATEAAAAKYRTHGRPLWRRMLLRTESAIVAAIVVLFVVAYTTVPYFAQPYTFMTMFLNSAPILLMLLPMTLIIMTGDIDLSVGSILGFSGTIFGLMFQAGAPLPVAAVVAVIGGGLVGVLNGVLVTQASAGFVSAVAEWVLGAMLDLARSTTAYASAYHRGRRPEPVMGRELCGATLGIIGYGRIARRLGELGAALGMRVLVSDPHVEVSGHDVRSVDLPALLAAADFVVCLAAANAQTANLMDARAFAALRPGSYFINASRGELVDEQALLAALDSGHLAGCALDVGRAADQMPTPELARHPRIIATPHVGGLTPGAIEHQALETVAQVEAIFQGRIPPGAVNAAQATRLLKWGGAGQPVAEAADLRPALRS